MRKLVTIAAIASLAACGSPEGEDTADLAPDAVTADVTPENVVEGEGGAPGMVTVQLALDEQCTSIGVNLRSATCTAEGLGGSFSCDYSLEQDPDGTQRSLTLDQVGDGWTIADEPEFCDSLSRANQRADEAAAPVSVDTQPTD